MKALITDLYEIRMSYVYFNKGMKDQKATFDVFFRKVPDQGGYAIYCGLESIIDYIKNFKFEKEDIEFLKTLNEYSDEFIEYLSNLKFSGELYSMKEGTVIFPYEPVLRITAPVIEAQLIETYLLMLFNHDSLIATKASRVCYSAKGRPVTEFGARRAHGEDAAVYGARAAYIGGCVGTSVVEDEKLFGIKSGGTMAHSFIQSYESEYEAFKDFALCFKEKSAFLVDTYDVLNSGMPNAIKVIKEVLEPMGIKQAAVRLDSGDLSYLSKLMRKMLDDAGLNYVKIMLTNSLDEYSIQSLLDNGTPVDLFGVGERLITSSSSPVLDGVYKMSAIERNGELEPVIKISASVQKITNPGVKKVYRIYNTETGNMEADLICLDHEVIDETKPLTIFDPLATFKKKTFKEYKLEELLKPIFVNGELVYESPSIKEIRDYSMNQVNLLWPEVKRFIMPHEYYVDLSKELFDLKNNLINREVGE